MVVTRNYRLAVAGVVAGVLLFLGMTADLVIGAVRHQGFRWHEALWLLIAVLWTVRAVGNVLWLRRQPRS